MREAYPRGGKVRAVAAVRVALCASGCQPDVTWEVPGALRHLEPDAVVEAKAQPGGSPPQPGVALPLQALGRSAGRPSLQGW